MRIGSIELRGANRRLSRLMVHPSSAEPDDLFAGLDKYQQLGGNCFYLHGEGGETLTRQSTGRWLRERGCRSDFFLATQICHDDWDKVNNCSVDRFTAQCVADDISRDLDLIGVEHLDLITLGDSPNKPFELVIDAIASEIGTRRASTYGLRNWSGKRIQSVLDFAAQERIPPPTSIFTTELSLARSVSPLWPEYVPFSPALEQTVRDAGLAVFAHVEDINIGQTLFADHDVVSRARPHWINRWHHPDNAGIVSRINALAQARDLTAREVNLGWVLHRPFPVIGIISLPVLLTASADQYVRASVTTFDPAELEALRAVD